MGASYFDFAAIAADLWPDQTSHTLNDQAPSIESAWVTETA
jgi:hypothetical protein